MADKTMPTFDADDRPRVNRDREALPDPWAPLRSATAARIGLGRNGDSMPLGPVLDFQLAHAKARDAVHATLDVAMLKAAIAPRVVLLARSNAPDRTTYLRRPDLGRTLQPEDRASLEGVKDKACSGKTWAGKFWDCVFVIADGLSAVAVERHAPALLATCLPLLEGLSIAPIVIATQARVALGDAIGEALGARLCIMLIGERPGLSVADSLGAYITFDPKPGRRDSERNCLSNIHAHGGLTYDQGASKLAWLIREALKIGVTGIALKDRETILLS